MPDDDGCIVYSLVDCVARGADRAAQPSLDHAIRQREWRQHKSTPLMRSFVTCAADKGPVHETNHNQYAVVIVGPFVNHREVWKVSNIQILKITPSQ